MHLPTVRRSPASFFNTYFNQIILVSKIVVVRMQWNFNHGVRLRSLD